MIRINLLPHREMRRERRKKDFMGLLVLSLVASGGTALLVALAIGSRIDTQQARNEFIVRENAKLDAQIKEIAQLREEIQALKARQQAVENLQRDRTLPVHVMDELVKHTPDGLIFKQVRQDDRKVSMVGLAQSNERVSNLLRALAKDTPWLERPELVEIKAVQLGRPDAKDKEARRVYEFSVNAMVKTPAADDPAVSAAARPAAALPQTVAAAAPAAPAAPAASK